MKKFKAEQIINSLLKRVRDHALNGDIKKNNGSLADDVTLVVIKKE